MIDCKNDENIKDIYDCTMTMFSHGIAVPSNVHPCGWDWLDFDYVGGEEYIANHRFARFEISNGICEYHEYENLTLQDILEITKGRFLFEINTNVDWGRE